MKRLATALLVAAAAGYLLARVYEPVIPAIGYLRAFCEAAMIGGLADWFAVTALFRHPLGVPLPHTAIVPRNKDRIGAALGRFVETHFLTTEVLREKLEEIDFVGAAARWLADPARSADAVHGVAGVLPRLLEALDAGPLRHFVERSVHESLQRVEVAPLAADVLETLIAQNRHQALLDELLRLAERFLTASEPELRERVRARTAWLLQRLGVDDAISDRLLAGTRETLAEVLDDPTHPWRERLTNLIREQIEPLRGSPELRARVEAGKRALLAHPALGAYIGALWARTAARWRADAARPDSRLRREIESALPALGRALEADPALCRLANGALRRAALALVERRRFEAGELIAQTVRRWDTAMVTRRVEEAMGDDLQYIRINGTLIGGLVGVLLHGISRALAV